MAVRALAKKAKLWHCAVIASGSVGGVALCDKDVSSYFDPEALERGAKAVREINKSPFAKKVCKDQNSWFVCTIQHIHMLQQ